MSFYYQRTRAFLLLSPACVASYQSYFLAVARYARGNKTANLLNNQTKSGKESIDRFGFKNYVTVTRHFIPRIGIIKFFLRVMSLFVYKTRYTYDPVNKYYLCITIKQKENYVYDRHP